MIGDFRETLRFVTMHSEFRAGEMDFKVQGPWKTEKYCRPPWLIGKKNI